MSNVYTHVHIIPYYKYAHVLYVYTVHLYMFVHDHMPPLVYGPAAAIRARAFLAPMQAANYQRILTERALQFAAARTLLPPGQDYVISSWTILFCIQNKHQ